MLRGYKYRMYPDREQVGILSQYFGNCRFVYNLALETQQCVYSSRGKNLSTKELSKQLTDLKKGYPWLHECDSQALQQSLRDLDKAYVRMYKKIAKYPNFKKRNMRQSFRYPHGKYINVDFANGTVAIPRFNNAFKVVFDRQFIGKVKNITFSRETTGKYYVSIMVDNGLKVPKKVPVKFDSAIGIDLGIKSFMVTSNGLTVDNPRHLKKIEKTLKHRQCKASKKKKGSNNRKKANKEIALLHEKIKFQRKDFLHKLSTWIVNNHDTICLETLKVKNLMKNHKLAKAIGDVGWGMLVNMIEYKAKWAGKNVIKIGTFEPSSKMCGNCGDINKTLTLEHREWACASCGTLHDRDLNAAKNIKNIAILQKQSGRGTSKEPVELPTIVGATKQEVRCYQ